MADDAVLAERREQARRRKAFQAWLDTRLTPESPAPAEVTRANWKPILQLQQGGPHVGEREDNENPQRI